MTSELRERLEQMAERGEWRGADRMVAEARADLDPSRVHLAAEHRRRPSWVFAFGAAVVTLVLIGGTALLLWRDGGSDPVVDQTTAATAAPSTTATPTTQPVTTTAAAEVTTTTSAAATSTTASTLPPPPPTAAITWQRAPEQESLEEAALAAVAVYDGRLFAGGYVVEEGTLYDEGGWMADGAVWVSDDGLMWERTAFPTFDDDGTEEVAGLVAGPGQLLAFGYRSDVGASAGARTMVWVSSDGEAWEEASGAIPDSALVYDVTSIDSGWVAVGYDRIEGAMAWASEDGLTWTEAAIIDPLHDDPGYLTEMYSVTDTGAGLVAVGSDEAGEHAYVVGGYTRCAAAWFSETGRSWDRITAPDLCEDEGYFDRVVTDPAGGVRVQGGYFLWAAPDPADPGSWHAVSESRPLPAAAIGDVALALGPRGRLPSVSDDAGETWTEVDGDASFDGGFLLMTDVVAFDGRFVAVGEDPIYEGLPGRAAAWVGMIEE